MKEKFDYPPETEHWILKAVNKKWKDRKADLKAMYFDPFKSMEQIQVDVPEGVEPTQWRILVSSWYTEKSKVIF